MPTRFAMTTPESPEPIKNGTIVPVRNSGLYRAEGVEYRGPLGPKGARVYGPWYGRKPRPAYIEVLEDQLEILEEPRAAQPVADRGGSAAASAIDPGGA